MDEHPRTVAGLQTEYQEGLAIYFDELADAIKAIIESPIEELMIWAMIWRSSGSQYLVAQMATSHLPGADPDSMGVSLWAHSRSSSWQRDLHLQPLIRVGDARYRLDIAMELRSAAWPHAQVFVAIECDGHDFHEKTKEQAERDKRRDRDLQSIGWIIARFTGAEIVRDPAKAAFDVCVLANGILQQRERAEAEIAHQIEAKKGGR